MEQAERLNVVLLLADEHSTSATGAYGPTLADTPSVDQLASEGVLFEHAYCNAPVCVPSRLSFLSGRYVSNIGAWSNLSQPPTDAPSLAQMLRKSGYDTIAVGKMHFVGDDTHWGFESRPYGDLLGRGHQPDPIASAPNLQLHPAGPAEIPEEDMQETIVTNTGIAELRRLAQGDRPFFLMLSYNRPHFPLRPPQRLWEKYYPERADLPVLPAEHPRELHPGMRHHRRFYRVDALSSEVVRRGRAAYYACCELVDDQVGRVMQALRDFDLVDRTVVIYMSDHGEMFGNHGLWLKTNFYEEAVRVPFIFRLPQAQHGGRRVKGPVELVDLVPTVLELANLASDAELDGKSLVSLLADGVSDGVAVSEYTSHSARGPMRMIRVGDWKYWWFADERPSLFNLKEDPEEWWDLANDGRVARMVCRELDALMRRGWDEASARENFTYRPGFSAAEVHTVQWSPNQFVDPDGTVRDAESFYEGVAWSPWTTLTLGSAVGEFGE